MRIPPRVRSTVKTGWKQAVKCYAPLSGPLDCRSRSSSKPSRLRKGPVTLLPSAAELRPFTC